MQLLGKSLLKKQREVKRVDEAMDITQGKLVMGFRAKHRLQRC